MKHPVVLGLDPGFASFGWAAVQMRGDLLLVLALGAIRTAPATKKRRVRATDDNLERAREIAGELAKLCVRFEPIAFAAEAMSFPRSSSVAAKMAMAWGIVVDRAESSGLPIVQSTPQELKRVVCDRRDASKDDVAAAVRSAFGPEQIDAALAGIPAGQHEHPIDALAAVLASMQSEPIRMARRMVA